MFGSRSASGDAKPNEKLNSGKVYCEDALYRRGAQASRGGLLTHGPEQQERDPIMTWPPRADAPPDSHVRAFLDAIADSPDDVGTRLVFADWLEERGDPRSEILRLQAAHLRGKDSADIERRVETWLGTYGRDWLGAPSRTPDGFSLRLEADLLAIGSQSRQLKPLLRGGPRL